MRIVQYALVILALVFVCCATGRQGSKVQETQQLQSRIADLEKELQQKDEEIWNLKNELGKAEEGLGKTKINESNLSVNVKLSIKEIQTALKKAGFYNGAIDGKAGKNTNKAIMEFQKANGLKADGIVGKKTSEKLKKYLE